MGKNYVLNGAKLECQLCTKPEGKLMVTSNAVKVQDKIWATEADKEKANLIFEGNCKKSPFQAAPCAGVMVVADWEGTADALIQDNKALLEDSQIMCTYGGVPIIITDDLQVNVPTSLMPLVAPVILPVEEPKIVKLEWKDNEILKEEKNSEEDVEEEYIESSEQTINDESEESTANYIPYSFNPNSNFGKGYSKVVEAKYSYRESWNPNDIIIEGRSYELYLEVDDNCSEEDNDFKAIPILEDVLFGIAIHHSGNDDLNTMKKVQYYHQFDCDDKRADIGYHFGIDLNGNIFEGRPIGVKGSHLDAYNTGIVGIVFLADFDHQWWDFDDDITDEAFNSAIHLIEALKEQFPKIESLGGHKEWKNNLNRHCPGEYGLEYVRKIRKQVNLFSPKEKGHG